MIKEEYKKMFLEQEANRCLLCYDAPCNKACPKGLDPAGFIKSIKFDNNTNLDDFITKEACSNCDAPCSKACIHYDFPIRIKEMVEESEDKSVEIDDIDLSIDFLNVKCENPFFLSSSIVAGSYEMCKKALEMGWGGVVYKTICLFETQETSPRFDATRKSAGSSFQGFRNLELASEHPVEEDIETLRRLKEEFPTKVIVASIMGQTEEEWMKMTELVTKANVDIIELNFSCPHMTAHGLGSDVGQNPELLASYVKAVKSVTNKPVVAKMTPNIGHMELPAIAAFEAGADGLAAINTIKCITGINFNDKSELSPHQVLGKSAVSGYSGRAVKPIALRFIHDMVKCDKLKNVPITGMGGIETWQDAAEFIALGCSNIQVTTSVMEYGYRIITDMIRGFKSLLKEKGYKSIKDFVGSSIEDFVPSNQLDRTTVVFPNIDQEKCIGCGRCYLSCSDAGHQAIIFDEETRKVKLNGKNCVGCHLCSLVCPVEAITKTKRVNKIRK